MERIPIGHRLPFVRRPCGPRTASGINLTFARLSPDDRQVGYALLTRAPVATRVPSPVPRDAPRLACVKPVASVHPEPGSNSSLYVYLPRPNAEAPGRSLLCQDYGSNLHSLHSAGLDGSLFYPRLSTVLLLYYCIVYMESLQRTLFSAPSVLTESGCKGRNSETYHPNF